MDFFDRQGKATVYLVDGTHLYNMRGRPLGYINDSKVYSFTGKFLGWFENGWLYDAKNNPALFCAEASGGPMKPMRAMVPMKGMRSMLPMKNMRKMTPMRPMKSSSWSALSGETYFAHA